MAINISAGDMDLIHDAVENIMRQVASGALDSSDGMTEVVGLIDLAATDNPTFMAEIRKLANA